MRLLFLAVLLTWSTLLHSSLEDVVIPCEGCRHDAAAWMASSVVGLNLSGYVYVVNFETEDIWRFHVQSDVMGGSSHSKSSPADVDPQVKALFDDWLRVKAVPDSIVIDASESVGVQTVYDFIGTRNQTLIGNNIFDNKSVLLNFPEEVISDSPSFVYWAASTYFSKNKSVEITVEFPDGSKAMYKMDFPKMLDESTVDIDYVAESCVDSDGNSIPEKVKTFENSSGELFIKDLHGANFSRWKARAERLGFELVGNYEDFASSVCSYNCFRFRCKLKCQSAN